MLPTLSVSPARLMWLVLPVAAAALVWLGFGRHAQGRTERERQGALHLWQSTEGSSQIVVGFFAASLLSTLFVLSFWSALKATAAKLEQQHETAFEHAVVQAYRYLPMLSLAGMLAYLASQI